MVRSFLCGAAPASLVFGFLVSGVAQAQNGSNYHVLTNGADALFLGIGAGGTQTALDGLGTFIAGEDLRGSHVTALGDFGFRFPSFTEDACVLQGPIIGGGPLAVRFPLISFIELDGLNGNAPAIFTNPACTVPSFPLGTSGFIPYGTGPGSSASFVLSGLPSVAGMPTVTILLPNNGFVPSAGGTATLLAAASAMLPIASTGLCWQVKFTWVPSALPLLDDIDGLWHYVTNSPDENQYWAFSDNEQNIWQSQTVATDGGLTAVLAFFANDDYALQLTSAEPDTVATLAPRPGGDFATTTVNVSNEFGAVVNPNGGFDAGRGSAAISFSGKAGVPNPATGLGNQDPSAGPGTVGTLGFATWDNGGDGDGSVRLVWLSFDFLGAVGGNPATDPGVTKLFGTIRVPVVSAGLLQPLTSLGFGLLGHVTRPGFPFGIGGASWQVATGPQPAACTGIAVNITYGSSGRKGVLGAPGKLTWNPDVADTSGTRQLFLFD
ncbi:MAG TPA: hypothetical protein VFY71_05420 [Planctomycetota bacterium]|nr:hypothetical protein [Planctomycetota bacterium]